MDNPKKPAFSASLKLRPASNCAARTKFVLPVTSRQLDYKFLTIWTQFLDLLQIWNWFCFTLALRVTSWRKTNSGLNSVFNWSLTRMTTGQWHLPEGTCASELLISHCSSLHTLLHSTGAFICGSLWSHQLSPCICVFQPPFPHTESTSIWKVHSLHLQQWSESQQL